MDFAKKQLFKFGWTEGKGLGKNEDGIAEALKPKLKFDSTGVGHDSSEQFTFNWWENVFNNTADNINVTKSTDGEVKIDLNSQELVNVTTKKYVIKDKKNRGLEYGSFLKTSKLTGEGTFDYDDKETCTTEEVVLKTVNLTDDELFAACGGRTAHKGARHGLKLNGKLSRIEQQEKELAKRLVKNMSEKSRTTIFTDILKDDKVKSKSKIEEKHKKKKKNKEENSENLDIESDSCLEIKKKKRKRTIEKTDNEENEIEEEAVRKRYENYCDRKYNRKLKKKRKREEKQISKMADMMEHCTIEKDRSSDDGFDECINTKKFKFNEYCEEKILKVEKHISKKKKKKNKVQRTPFDDAGFSELITQISDKLTESKELKKKIKQQKKKYEDDKISNISDVLDKVCKV